MNTPDRQQDARKLRRENRVLAGLAFLVWAVAATLVALNVHLHPAVTTPCFTSVSTPAHCQSSTLNPTSNVSVTVAVAASVKNQNPVQAQVPGENTGANSGQPSNTGTSAGAIPTSTVTSSPARQAASLPPLLVAAGGDVLGDRGVGAYLDRHGGQPVFEHVRPLLETAHLAFVNLEGPVSDKGARATWKEYTFRARPALLDGLVSAGVDMVSLANNHVLDYGPAALIDAFARLERAGICYAGAGKDIRQARAPAILATPAGTVAFFAFTNIIPGGFAATKSSPGVNPVLPEAGQMQAVIKTWSKRVDFVVVSFHWGTEYQFSPDPLQQQLAHQAVEAGADLILGHHPHVIQGLEIYQGSLIAYSLGDFLWDHYSRETGETFILRAYLAPGGMPTAEIVPVYLEEESGVPQPVSGEAAQRILDRLKKLCGDLGVELVVSGSQGWIGFNPLAAGE